MKTSAAPKLTLTDISSRLAEKGDKLTPDTEIRVSPWSKVLYVKSTSPSLKSKLSDLFKNRASRTERQDKARALIREAVAAEFKLLGGRNFTSFVVFNMRDFFNGRGAVTSADVEKVRAEVLKVKFEEDTYQPRGTN